MAIKLEEICKELLERANITINGNQPWDIRIHNNLFFKRVLTEGSLALGESYMDGWWDCERLDLFFNRLLQSRIDKESEKYLSFRTKISIGIEKLKTALFNEQNVSKSKRVAEQHYDIGNYLYEKMLGRTMAYSCGYWRAAKTLDEAQESKFDLICKKLGFEKGLRVLEIGCGFGSFLEYATRNYGINGIGITLSKEQGKSAEERCKDLNVKIKLQDYRNLNEKFDRVVSIGMFEHVGPKNYRKFFEVVDESLENDGLFLLHTIGKLNPSEKSDPWILKYIFPGGVLPTETQIINASNRLFVNEDLHNLRVHYARTLEAWHNNFTKNWQEIEARGNGAYDTRFKRMWDYYLLSCKSGFESNENQLWQFVFSKYGNPKGYESIR